MTRHTYISTGPTPAREAGRQLPRGEKGHPTSDRNDAEPDHADRPPHLDVRRLLIVFHDDDSTDFFKFQTQCLARLEESQEIMNEFIAK